MQKLIKPEMIKPKRYSQLKNNLSRVQEEAQLTKKDLGLAAAGTIASALALYGHSKSKPKRSNISPPKSRPKTSNIQIPVGKPQKPRKAQTLTSTSGKTTYKRAVPGKPGSEVSLKAYLKK